MNISMVLLTVVFVVLKVMNYISWSWLWVLSPIWISTIFSFVIVIFFGSMFKKFFK